MHTSSRPGPIWFAAAVSGLLVTFYVCRVGAQRLEDGELEAGEAETATHPPDPFAGRYELPQGREIGTTAGQFRIFGSAMLVAGREGVEPGLHGTLELMTYAYLSVRGSLQTTVAAPAFEPVPVFVAKTGPSLHLLPYRRVDLSLFFEGGVGVVSATKHDSAPMAVASPGATFELWLSHWALLRAEGHVDCGFYNRAGVAHKYVQFGALLGAGIAL
jgi:hypothetical protein